MTYFDETLFTVVPRLYRAVDGALDPACGGGAPAGARSGRAARPSPTRRRPTPGGRERVRPRVPGVPALGQLDRRRPGRQPGGDRGDDRPRPADPRRSRDPRLRGGRDPADADRRRDGRRRTTSRRRSPDGWSPTTTQLPETMRQLRRRFPDEPYRQRFGAIAERLRRTRAALTAGPASPIGGRYTRPGASCFRARRDRRGARSRIDSGGSPGARSRTSAGRSRRSASTWPRSRSVSTARSTRRRSTAIRRGDLERGPARVARRDRRGGAGDVPGDRGHAGAVRPGRGRALRDQLHPAAPATSSPSSSWPGWPAPPTRRRRSRAGSRRPSRPSTSSRCSNRPTRSRAAPRSSTSSSPTRRTGLTCSPAATARR